MNDVQQFQNFNDGRGYQNQWQNQDGYWEMQNRIWFRQAMTDVEIRKKAEFAAINVRESEIKAKVHSDIASQKELQLSTLNITSDGTVTLNKEQFGANIHGKLPIIILQAKLIRALGKCYEAEVLIIRVEGTGGRINQLLFNADQMENRFIMRQFDKAGIFFGFGIKKEQEIKKMLVLSLMREAAVLDVPVKHGWYQWKDKWYYAYPQDMTWKEVMAWI